MKEDEIRICILRVGGTNCDAETSRSFHDLGVKSEVHHANEVIKNKDLSMFDGLVLPGGFSYGDYVRAGAIFAKRIISKLKADLETFIEEEKPVLGICNGFQILVEAGLLPGYDGISDYPEAALATNLPIGYRCKWVHVKHENQGRCVFSSKIPKNMVLKIPIAHAEGRFIFSKKKEDYSLKKLYDNDQLVFRYCDDEGRFPEGAYPVNPNGSFHDIAGICNPAGTIMGLMPHPERAYYEWQTMESSRKNREPLFGDGRLIFKSMIEYIKNRF